MKQYLFLAFFAFAMAACGESATKEADKTNADKPAASTASTNPDYDPKRGEGKFSQVAVDPNLNTAMAESGEKVFTVKCSSCHKLSEEKLVGPGWKGVTARHAPEWIMNFVTNPDVMLDKDPKAQAMLELCLVRMPNQNLSDDEARNVYEFMRKNDGVK